MYLEVVIVRDEVIADRVDDQGHKLVLGLHQKADGYITNAFFRKLARGNQRNDFHVAKINLIPQHEDVH